MLDIKGEENTEGSVVIGRENCIVSKKTADPDVCNSLMRMFAIWQSGLGQAEGVFWKCLAE